MDMREKVAQTLARQTAESGNSKLNMPFDVYWDAVLTERKREEYLSLTDEVIDVVMGKPAQAPSYDVAAKKWNVSVPVPPDSWVDSVGVLETGHVYAVLGADVDDPSSWRIAAEVWGEDGKVLVLHVDDPADGEPTRFDRGARVRLARY